MAYNRSLIGIIGLAFASVAGWASAAAGTIIEFSSKGADHTVTWAGNLFAGLIKLVMLPFRLFAPAASIPLDHALHETRADDVRRAAPFKAFFERARSRYTFVGDHFHASMAVGT